MKQTSQASTSSSPDTFDAGEFVTAGNVSILMHLLQHTQEEEAYSCAETFALLDEYVETAVQNEGDAVAVMPLVKQHLDACPDCRKEFEALLRILETEYLP